MIDYKINKELEVGTHLSFIINNKLVDGYIREKNQNSTYVDFLIETEDNRFCRIKHSNLDLYYIYKK